MNNTRISIYLVLILIIGIGSAYAAHFLERDYVYFLGVHLSLFIAFYTIKSLLGDRIIPSIICSATMWLCIGEWIDEALYCPTEIEANDIFLLFCVIAYSIIEYTVFIKKKNKTNN